MENFKEERNSRLRRPNRNNNNRWTGVILLLVGVGVFLSNLDTDLPRWLFRWETALILLGLFVGIRHKFRGFGWFIMVAVGGISLLDVVFPLFLNPRFTWAAVAIAVGIYIILQPRSQKGDLFSCKKNDYGKTESSDGVSSEPIGRETLDVTAVFGNVKKIVVSKNFKGGEVTAVMGGTEIDLSQADIHGRVALEATNILGGTKLIIPPTWDVQSEMVAIFGGVEDKRDVHSLQIDPNKILVLEGTCIFGGLEIRNY